MSNKDEGIIQEDGKNSKVARYEKHIPIIVRTQDFVPCTCVLSFTKSPCEETTRNVTGNLYIVANRIIVQRHRDFLPDCESFPLIIY